MVMLLVLASAPASAMGSVPAGSDAPCDPQAYEGLLGKPYTDGMVDYAGRLRVVPFDSAITMDFLPDRLNLFLDEAGTVDRITCG